MEEARTNLFRYSQALSNVDLNLITTDNATVSPAGTQNASLCIPTSDNVEHYIDDQTVIAGTDYAISCFAKYGSGSYLLAFRGSGIGANPPQFNLQTGTVVTEGASGQWSNTKIEDVGNGWYKCSSVGNPNTTTPLRFQILRSDGAPNFTGDGTGHYIWGIQIEQNSFPTSYIPTSGSAVTRAADVASLAVSEFGYNQDQGTVVIERRFLSNAVNSNSGTDLLEDGSNKISLRKAAYLINVNGAGQTNNGYGSPIDYVSFHKIGVAFKPNSVIGSTSGGLSAEDTSALIPDAVNTIQLNRVDTNASLQINGHIKSVQYYPLRLSNAQLQALTV